MAMMPQGYGLILKARQNDDPMPSGGLALGFLRPATSGASYRGEFPPYINQDEVKMVLYHLRSSKDPNNPKLLSPRLDTYLNQYQKY